MKNIRLWLVLAGLCLGLPAGPALAGQAQDISAEIKALRQQMNEMQRNYEARLQEMQRRLDALPAAEAKPADGDAALEKLVAQKSAAPAKGQGSVPGMVEKLNPDVSVVLDTYYYHDDTSQGMTATLGSLRGFGHVHGGHEHADKFQRGFNLNHAELRFSAQVDPYFKAWVTAAVDEEGAEMEEAVMQTTSLPLGFQVKAGKFFSDMGRINSQHSHEWDFVNQPLIYRLLLGEHNLLDKGVQVSWLAPTPFQLLLGLEALEGANESSFNYVGESGLPSQDGPRLWVGWLKYAPNLGGRHGLQLGVSYARGVHQEAHDEDSDGTTDLAFDGHSQIYGLDAVYKYKGSGPHGLGDFVVQGEYLYRQRDLSVAYASESDLLGRARKDKQDGYYLQATYGFAPRWRLGARWDQAGLTNQGENPEVGAYDYGDSRRLSAMVDFSPTEFSRLRLQGGQVSFDLEDGREEAWEVLMQLQVSFGVHGAHKF